MFPLRDLHQPARPPFVTRLLLTLNILVFLYQCFDWLSGGDGLIRAMGVRPVCYLHPAACGISLPTHSDRLWQPLIVSLFLHGGVLHLAFNMLFLWVFGPGVEERLGRGRFLVCYLGCGLAASLAHIVTHPGSAIPCIGASGAIAGVLGLYLILLPRSWVLTYFPPIFLFPVPAPLFLVVWLLLQVLNGFKHLPGFLPQPHQPDVAWMAHIGGFALGAALGWAMQPRRKRRAARAKRA